VGLVNIDTLVIIATLNEEQAIGPTLNEVNHSLKKPLCIVVDGHSVDRTVDIAKVNGAQVIFQNGLGKGDAVATALKNIKEIYVKYVAMIDADFTYPARYFSVMTKILDKNPEVGMVCGNRFADMETEAMPFQFHLGNRILSFFHNFLSGLNLQDPLTGFRVIRQEIVNKWVPKSKGFDIEVELNSFVKNCGFSIVEIPIKYRRRLGEKKLKFNHGFDIFRRIMLETLSSVSK
jgi:dolichol-phosphate mannosyltransferase